MLVSLLLLMSASMVMASFLVAVGMMLCHVWRRARQGVTEMRHRRIRRDPRRVGLLPGRFGFFVEPDVP